LWFVPNQPRGAVFYVTMHTHNSASPWA
jgi:hypothetical protein